jgi:hypothetical protein
MTRILIIISRIELMFGSGRADISPKKSVQLE